MNANQAHAFWAEVEQEHRRGFNALPQSLKDDVIRRAMLKFQGRKMDLVSSRGISGARIMFPDGSAFDQKIDDPQKIVFYPAGTFKKEYWE